MEGPLALTDQTLTPHHMHALGLFLLRFLIYIFPLCCRPLKAAHRDRASLYPIEPDPLVDEVRDRLLERLLDCTRDFKNALVLGGSGWQVLQALHANSSRTSLSSASKRASGGIEKVTLMDTSPGMLDRARRNWERLKSDSWHHAGPGFDARGMPSYGTAHEQEEGNLPTGKPTSLEADFVLADAETEVLPVEPKSFDGRIVTRHRTIVLHRYHYLHLIRFGIAYIIRGIVYDCSGD